MEQVQQLKEKRPGSIEKGRYVYCVAKSNEQKRFGKIGIENNNVYTIASNSLIAIVHDCEAMPYESNDIEKVKQWVMAHEQVIEKAKEEFGTVVPLSFDVIIKGNNATRQVANWLKAEKQRLKSNLEKVKGKQEFAVQIIFDRTAIGKKLGEEKEEIKKLVREAEQAPKGKAYFIKQEIRNVLKQEIEKLADKKFRDFYSEIKKYCSDIKLDKNKSLGEEKQMLLNLSCLVEKTKVKDLGKALDLIGRQNGFSAGFTGPWPPYSFVS